NDLHGQCGSDADCSTGARCDKTQSPPVCVAATCSPACDSTSSCDLQSVTCKPVTQASVVVTSPTANGFVGRHVSVAATSTAAGRGVTYPSQPPGATNGFLSGHDGTQFILNDQIHLRGTVTDGGAGLSCASLQYRIDGVDRNGATVRGPTTQPLPGCTADGTKTVSFDVPAVAINDTTKYGALGAGSGNLQVVILASDGTTGAQNAMAENPTVIK